MIPSGHTFQAEIGLYHREMERAFGFAAGDLSVGTPIAEQAREILLDAVILPYNRLLGQRKRHDSLFGYGANAEDVFFAWLRSSPDVPPPNRVAVKHVFRELIRIMDEHREGSKDHWGDSRLVWIPLHYAIELEDHDTQAEMDALIERALQKPFTRANEVGYVINQQFHIELR